MMIQEFEQLTGLHPTMMEYAVIEDMYYDFNGDKREFCKKFADQNEPMLNVARMVASELKSDLDKVQKDAAKEKADMEAKIKRLEEQLEREQEWQPYECEHNVKQADYERLVEAGGTRELSDDEAADMIAGEFGFDRSKIVIVHEVVKEEINRHRQCRKVGTIPRKALFNAWDWNYIVFNIRGNVTMGYEMYDGDLRQYWG